MLKILLASVDIFVRVLLAIFIPATLITYLLFPSPAMAATSLRRVGQNTYNAMLTGSKEFPTWSKPTLLVRFTEKNGLSTMFTLTGDALVQFKALEQWRIYLIDFPGSVVKNNSSSAKFGVEGAYEVRLTHACKLSISKDVWPLQLPYAFTPFADLNQMEGN